MHTLRTGVKRSMLACLAEALAHLLYELCAGPTSLVELDKNAKELLVAYDGTLQVLELQSDSEYVMKYACDSSGRAISTQGDTYLGVASNGVIIVAYAGTVHRLLTPALWKKVDRRLVASHCHGTQAALSRAFDPL